MREIAETFSKLSMRGEGGLIAYVTAGDPELSYTSKIVEALVDGGADIIELGIPFSDPIADGPTIQAASVRALKTGTTPKGVLKLIESIKGHNNVPILIMTYYNSIYRWGLEKFFQSAKASGVDGIIVPDLPVEEADEYKKIAENYEIDTIFLGAPSTSADRMKKIVEYTSGFLYLVSVFGVTGTRETIQESTIELIKRTRSITRGKIPLAVGFGLSKPEHVEAVIKNGADMAIVGSGFMKIVEKQDGEEEMLKVLKGYARELKKATLKGATQPIRAGS